MSTASHVKETYELTGDDARETLMATGRIALMKDAIVRLRAADGTSHSRGMAFAVSLVLVQGLVVIVGFAVALGSAGFRQLLLDTIQASAPGPTSELLTNAVEQATQVGRRNRYLPLTIGLIGTLLTATVAMGQLERAMNRIYGIEKDRPFEEKYKRAFVLAVSAGAMIAASFTLLAFGRGLIEDGAFREAWLVIRWPIGIALAAGGARGSLPLGAEATAARVGLARFRSGSERRGLVARNRRARALLQLLEDVRRDVRIARRARRAPALDVLLGAGDSLRRRCRSAARSGAGWRAGSAGSLEGRDVRPRADLRLRSPTFEIAPRRFSFGVRRESEPHTIQRRSWMPTWLLVLIVVLLVLAVFGGFGYSRR